MIFQMETIAFFRSFNNTIYIIVLAVFMTCDIIVIIEGQIVLCRECRALWRWSAVSPFSGT